MTWGRLEQLRDQITLAYAARGYVSSGAVIPDQTVKDGLFTIRVVEGRLADIEVETDGRFRTPLLERRLQRGTGDERSGLGLAGVAINAGARSAVGSLWSIADEATYRLMVSFYSKLGEPGTSKAEALRQAQIAIHENERYHHPFFWSPFLMINNWQ